MNPPPEACSDMVRAIQLALAPVFLLTGIAGLLSVMTGRLARIVDRVRELGRQAGPAGAIDPAHRVLERRRRFSSIAITTCTIAAMLALVIGLAFFLREVHLAMRATRSAAAGERR
jgi:uncharacterized protein involved in cysteine biosynthesis